mmetsp:Transcript_47532/g.132518  ORF Transcript_47532/g.132518 Transcript_47532/m.132518 type:complete len:235 (-) Transcript_47532:1486-2190(-)
MRSFVAGATVRPSSVFGMVSNLSAPLSRTVTMVGAPLTPPVNLWTWALKPYQTVRASTMTQSPAASASSLDIAPGKAMAAFCAAPASSAASSCSSLNSSMASPTILTRESPLPSRQRPEEILWSRFSCAATRSLCSDKSWLCKCSFRIRRSASKNCNRSVFDFTSSTSRFKRASVSLAWNSRAPVFASCASRFFSSFAARRSKLNKERWSSPSNTSARCTVAAGSSILRAVSIA